MLQPHQILKVLVVFLTAIILTNPAWSQDLRKASLSGKVITTTGEALVGASVVLKDLNLGTNSDAKGRFELTDLAPGNYVVVISLVGFEIREKAVQLKVGQTEILNLSLTAKNFEMKGVEVVGKSVTRQINEQPYAVTAISIKELQNSSQDAKEVLNRVSGVRVQEEGGLGSNVNFSLNGFSGDQVKFFLDGIPMDNFGSSLSLSDIPVNSIDRIEVYKGVVPVWLGTDALGGAVNIITNKKSKFLDASYSFGSFNTHRVSLNGAHTDVKTGFTFRANANYNYSDNNYKVWVPITKGYNITDSAEVERFHDRYRSGMVKLEAGWQNRKFADNLLFGVMVAGNDKQVQTGITMNRAIGGVTRTSRSVVPTFKYSKDDLFIKGLNVSLFSAYNCTRSEIVDTLRGVRYNWLGDTTFTKDSKEGELGTETSLTTLTDDDFNSQFNAGYVISPAVSVALNYAYSYFYRIAFDSENPDKSENKFPKSFTKQQVGFALKFDPTPKWTTTIFSKYYFLQTKTSKEFGFGGDDRRTEATEQQKKNLGYGLATAYFLLPKLQLKASYEHAYRMPWPDEIFGDGVTVTANPYLNPEKSDNLNLGAAYGFNLGAGHQFNLESSLIYREARDLIYRTPSKNPRAPFLNLAEARTTGVEGSLKYRWREFLQVGGSLTFQDITDQADSIYNESTNEVGWKKNWQKGYRLPNTPHLFGNAHVGLTFKELLTPESVWNVNYYFNFVQQYYLGWVGLGYVDTKNAIPRQTSHNLEISCSLKQGKYNLSAECRNLANARLYDNYFLQKPGRAFYLKLRYVL